MSYGLVIRKSNGDPIFTTDTKTFQVFNEVTKTGFYSRAYNYYIYTFSASTNGFYKVVNLPVKGWIGKSTGNAYISNQSQLTFRDFSPANVFGRNNNYGIEVFNENQEKVFTTEKPLGNIHRVFNANYYTSPDGMQFGYWFDGFYNNYPAVYYPTDSFIDERLTGPTSYIQTEGENWFGIPPNGLTKFPAHYWSSITMYRKEIDKIYLIQKPIRQVEFDNNNPGVFSRYSPFSFLTLL